MAKKKVYAVRTGHQPGLYETWAECEAQVKGFAGAEFKGFKTREEALSWLGCAAEVSQGGVGDERTPGCEGEEGVGIGRQVGSPASPLPWEEDGRSHRPEEISRTVGIDDTGDARGKTKERGDVKEVDLAAKRQEKASAFVDFLRSVGEHAELEAGRSEHYHRIAFPQGGFAHLYLTKNKPFDLQLTGFKDKERRSRIERLWRMFHWQVGQVAPIDQVDRWKAVEHYYLILKPFRHLPFDFIALAQTLEAATDGALTSENLRYDFDQIEAAYLRLRP